MYKIKLNNWNIPESLMKTNLHLHLILNQFTFLQNEFAVGEWNDIWDNFGNRTTSDFLKLNIARYFNFTSLEIQYNCIYKIFHNVLFYWIFKILARKKFSILTW